MSTWKDVWDSKAFGDEGRCDVNRNTWSPQQDSYAMSCSSSSSTLQHSPVHQRQTCPTNGGFAAAQRVMFLFVVSLCCFSLFVSVEDEHWVSYQDRVSVFFLYLHPVEVGSLKDIKEITEGNWKYCKSSNHTAAKGAAEWAVTAVVKLQRWLISPLQLYKPMVCKSA